MSGRPRLPVTPCKFCNRVFKRQEHLSRHLRTHTRERPFSCVCGQMFSRQDLLNRHRRLSLCSGTNSNSHHNADSSVVPAVTSTPVSNTSQDQPSSSSSSFQLQDSSHSAGLHANATTTASCAAPEMGPRNISSTKKSQKQLMGKFSMHDDMIDNKHQKLGQIPSEFRLSPRHSHTMHMGMETTSVDGNDLIQPQTVDIDFLSNETDLINDYLIGLLPALDYQDTMIHDLSDSYGGGTGSLTEALSPNNTDTPSLMQITRPTDHFQPFADQPRGMEPEDETSPTSHPSAMVDGSLDAIEDLVQTNNPWAVSSAAYEKLINMVSEHKHVLPTDFALPSRQRLSTFVASWIRGFYPHLPFIHLPTTSLDSMTPMLLLTLAATGSFYGFEHTSGYAMYFIAKSVINEALEKRRRLSTLHLLQAFPPYAEFPSKPSQRSSSHQPSSDTPPVDTELLQALLVLVLTMSWLDEPLAQDALAMSSQLTALTREALRDWSVDTVKLNWVDWARQEEQRRTILSAYFVLNIQTICFNVPPQITISEIKLALPCSEAEFKAASAEAWQELRQTHDALQSQFQHCLRQLLSGKPLSQEESVTEFGNYMLVQSLLMQIHLEHQAASALPDSPSSLSADAIALYDAALGAWQSCWDTAIGSALDPSTSPHGPLAFNSTAILRLAHVHLGVGLQSQSALLTRDARIIAQAFEPHRNPVPLRSPHLGQAVLHAICALRIPVRVGIAFVARGRTGHWSVQHAISNFACALFLTHWLENMFSLVAAEGLDSLQSEELRLLSTLDRLIEETHLEGSLGPTGVYPNRIRRLAVAAVKLWAETYTGIQVFEIVHVIGETLFLVAQSIEGRLHEDL